MKKEEIDETEQNTRSFQKLPGREEGGAKKRGATRKLLLNQDFDMKVFDVDRFKYWVKHNKVLSEEDFEYIKQEDKQLVSVRLSAKEHEDSKLEQVNIYLKFLKCL